MENDTVSEKKQSTAFDEQTLAKVLEAAYVLQEHNRQQQARENPRRERKSNGSPAMGASNSAQPVTVGQVPAKKSSRQDFPLVLAKIVETQQQIQAENPDPEKAMAVIAERAMQVAQAVGAGIGILEDGKVRYRATAGAMALRVGSEVPIEKALCSACLRVGQVIRCGSVNLEFLIDAEDCARRGIESLIAAPIHHAGSVGGALELYYGEPQSFTEPDVHACQLMAGLVAEVLARSEGLASKKSLQSERAAMRDALEKLKPNLEALVEPSAVPPSPIDVSAVSAPDARGPAAYCLKCGHELVGDEQFCGKCGNPRNGRTETLSMQSKVALLWQMQEQKSKTAVRNPVGASPLHASAGAFEEFTPEDLCETTLPELGELLPPELVPPLPSQPLVQNSHSPAIENVNPVHEEIPDEPQFSESLVHDPVAETAIVKTLPRPNWTSAAAAREFLERVARENRNSPVLRFLKARRGDVYLILAIILVAFVIRWGVWPEKPTVAPASPATTHHSVYADLSLFDRMLIKLGLADPPDPPVYKGNPNTKVWVDEQTALYYCPGSDLYGKTPKGRMTTQRDAQLDQFEPAYRKTCN